MRLRILMRLFAPNFYIGAFAFFTVFCTHAHSKFLNVAEADEFLTGKYKQALLRFPKGQEEPLRRAERAWITFSNKNEAVYEELLREKRIIQGTVDAATALEIVNRAKHLSIYFCEQTVPATDAQEHADKDQQLGQIYNQCMSAANPKVQSLLRDAERAWITYKEADAASVMALYNNPRIQFSALSHATEQRTTVLGLTVKIVNAPPTASPGEDPQQPEPPQDAPEVSPEASNEAHKFQENAKACLNQILSQKADSFFKKPDAIKQAHDFSPEVQSIITKLSSEYTVLSKNAPQRILTPLQNESSTILLLEGWKDFLRELTQGSIFEAGKILRSALSQKPSEILPEYRPIWDAVGNWEDAYISDEPKFQDHFHKAKELAEKGKTEDAIKEFQAAYDVIPNASVPTQIQKVREQSLGL